jgi:uncharacterized phage-associated protein
MEGISMASALDVAAYILNRQGLMTTWKLQKLVYYSQAWHLVWEEEPLFDEPIEAWANGPVVRALYNKHRGKYTVGPRWGVGDARRLKKAERESIDAVLDFYGDKSGHWLSELTHAEPPWKEARAGLGPRQRGERRVKRDAMAAYYGELVHGA